MPGLEAYRISTYDLLASKIPAKSTKKVNNSHKDANIKGLSNSA